jgi:catechol 2,3-dioxygenase-like lactoylglutathione lyase family enzyme
VLTHIDHLILASDDLEAAQRQCIALLGRSPSWSGSHPAFGTRNVIFRLANTYIELLAPDGEGPVADVLAGYLAESGPGLYALALGTADADAAVARMRERGLSPSEPVEGIARDDASGAFRRFRNVWLPEKDTRGVRLFAIEHLSEPELLPPALPLAAAEAVVDRLDHVVVMSAEPDRAIAFYGEQLGIRLALDRTFEKRGLRLLFFRLGGTTLEVSAPLRPDAELGAGEAENAADRLWGIAYSVADAGAARARMVEAGLDASELREGHKAGTRVFTVGGNPLGVPTLVIEPAAN